MENSVKKKEKTDASRRGRSAKKKGSRGELELSTLLKDYGLTSRRTAQFCGKSGDASDIVCEELSEYHIEVKRTETLSLYPAMDQAVRDSQGKKIPIVCHRRNSKKWLVIMHLEDFIKVVLTQSK